MMMMKNNYFYRNLYIKQVFQNLLHDIKIMCIMKLPSKDIHTQGLKEDQDDVSTCTYTKGNAYCPIGLIQIS